MKKIIRVARLELNNLFYSPIPWFLMVVLMFTTGLAYITMIDRSLSAQQIGGRYLDHVSKLTNHIFNDVYDGVFPGLMSKLYLYIPLLTMGLISRETSSGTIKLLYSSPLKISDIILGKFLAMVLVSFVLIGIISLVTIGGIFNINSPDIGLLLAGLFSFFLLLITYAAIGLFMSCLTTYQVVAALSTLVLLSVLNAIGDIWQENELMRNLTYFLSINGRAAHMARGLITSKDLFYFLLITSMFLAFSILKLQQERQSKPFIIKISKYILTFIIVITLGYLTSIPGFVAFVDATEIKSQTISANTQKIIKQMNAPLEVTSYINLLDSKFTLGPPSRRNEDKDRWEPYLLIKPDIKFKYIYYYTSSNDDWRINYPQIKTLEEYVKIPAKIRGVDINIFKTPDQISKIIDLKPEMYRYVMQLKYKDKTAFLRLYDDPMAFPSERETTAALQRLVLAKVPKIAFAEGNLERSFDKYGDKHYKVLTDDITSRFSLVNQGFDVEAVSLKDQEIPQDIAVLVIADPKINFDKIALAKLRRYIDSGGNLLIAGEPGRQSILNPILQPIGVQLMDGMIIQKSNDFSPDLMRSYLTSAGAAVYKKLALARKDSLCISMPNATGLTYDDNKGFTVKPLLMSNGSSSWNKRKPVNLDSADYIESNDNQANKYSASNSSQTHKEPLSVGGLRYNAAEGDIKGPLPTAISLTRSVNGKEQHIIVTGDADFLSNAELKREKFGSVNFMFSSGIFGWFTNGKFPVDTDRAKGKDNRINLTDQGLIKLTILYKFILPGLLALFGSILLIRRRRK